MNEILKFKDYALLKSNLNVSEERYQKIYEWEQVANLWLNNNFSIDKKNAILIFINKFLFKIPESIMDIDVFFNLRMNAFDINQLLEESLNHLSDKYKKYYKSLIISFIGDFSKQRNKVNIFYQNYLYMWVDDNFNKECQEDLIYFFEWDNIEEKFLIEFIKKIYQFYKNINNYKNLNELLCDEKKSNECIKKSFIEFINKENISPYKKRNFLKKFNEFFDWLIINYFNHRSCCNKNEINLGGYNDFIIENFGEDWLEIQNIVNTWLSLNKKSESKYRGTLKKFFKNMFDKGDSKEKFYEILSTEVNINLIELMNKNNECSELYLKIQCTQVVKFFNWFLSNYNKKNTLSNPFLIYDVNNPFHKFLLAHGVEWNNWLKKAHLWLEKEPKAKQHKVWALQIFFNYYANSNKWNINVDYFINEIHNESIKYKVILDIFREADENVNHSYLTNYVCEFINWIIINFYSDKEISKIKIDSNNFSWILIDYGEQWQDWVSLADGWLNINNKDISHKRQALKIFFINYLIKTPIQGSVELFFNGIKDWRINERDFYEKLIEYSNASPKLQREYYTIIVSFLDWVVSNLFSNKILNPLSKKVLRNSDPIYLIILEIDQDFKEWSILLKQWLRNNPKISHRKLLTPLKVFFTYLKDLGGVGIKIDNLLDLNKNRGNINREKYYKYLQSKGYTKNSIRFYIKWPSQFLEYIIIQTKNNNYFNPLGVSVRTDDLRKWFIHEYDEKWKKWCNYAEEWLVNHTDRSVKTSIIMFFENYLLKRPCNSSVELFFRGVDKWSASKDDLREAFKSCTNNTFKSYFHHINKFTYWVFNRYFSKLRYENILPPFGKVIRNLKTKKNKFQWFILEYGEEWSEWANLASDWILSSPLGQSRRLTNLSKFFEYYLVSFNNGYIVDNVFYSKNNVVIDKNLFVKMLADTKFSNTIQQVISDCSIFFEWVIKLKYKNLQVKLNNPFGTFRIKDGRSKDSEFKWFVNLYGEQWESWRILAAEWLATQYGSLSHRMRAVSIFLENYLALNHSEAYIVENFFSGQLNFYPTNEDLFNIISSNTNIKQNTDINSIINHIVKFIDWILLNKFTIENIHGFYIPKYMNPFDREKTAKILNESVHTPLPYHYIHALIKKLCPNEFGNFRDWHWAYSYLKSKCGGGWYDVPVESIDFDDLDCVWRKITTRNGSPLKLIEKYQLWSPVAAIGVFVKLHLPLRTYQTRMLDSGEADAERYEKGKWVKNKNKFAIPNLTKGVFKKITEYKDNQIYTGFYINTNKTADINKLPSEKGYVIPWQNEIVLYWLEKLRNWQEKYNKIISPTPCTSLNNSHLGQKFATQTLKEMGSISFLLRHAAAKKKEDRVKPILDSTLNALWLNLLIDFEKDIAKEGQTFSDGSRIKFVEISPNSKRLKYYPLFPLHSLRVSFITSYLQDGKVPLPILSKLIAGHSSLLMTMYYAKFSPNQMQTIISEAQNKMEHSKYDSLKLFIRDHDINEIQKRMVFDDITSISAILKGRNILGWEQKHHGICLAGGNTLDIRETNESTRNAGCWNGGSTPESEDKQQRLNVFEPVPHGAENCVRCRWFITHVSYIPQLVAHFNILSYKANLSANAARKAHEYIITLEKQKEVCLNEGKEFTEIRELERQFKQYKSELTEADEYCKDIIATLNIIERINYQEKNRNNENQKIIAVGNEKDIEFAFIENKSELLHLCILCDDAEIYPDLYNKLNKTPAIERRTRLISKMMLKKGYQPHYLFLSEDEQLKAINSMIREMSRRTANLNRFESFRVLIEHLEQESSNSTKGILENYMDERKNKYIKLRNL